MNIDDVSILYGNNRSSQRMCLQSSVANNITNKSFFSQFRTTNFQIFKLIYYSNNMSDTLPIKLDLNSTNSIPELWSDSSSSEIWNPEQAIHNPKTGKIKCENREPHKLTNFYFFSK